MARLSDLVNKQFESITEMEINEILIEALEILLEMLQKNELVEDEIQILNDTIDLIVENFHDQEIDEKLTEKRMSAKAKLYARRYRLKNRARLKMIAKKKKRCLAKIAGKTDKFTCNSKGQIKRIDKKRSRAAKIGARSR